MEAERRCAEATAFTGRDAYLFNLTTPAQCRTFATGFPHNMPVVEEDDDPVYVVDAYSIGGVGRFLNHACGPSRRANVTPIFVFVQEGKGPVDALE